MPAAAPRSLLRSLFTPVDNTPLVLFRMAFGLLLALECAGSIVTGWVRLNLIEPTVHFPMIGFAWIRPLPGAWMYAYYAVMAACGVLVMLGLRYRLALAAFAVLWAAAYVMQSVSYNNHYYLLLLLALVMSAVPAHAWASLDARRVPALRSTTCPRWCLLLLQSQVAVLYAFAALAKLDADWLAARPLTIWLASRADWITGPLLTHPTTAHVLAWGGLLFDALIVPLLCWKRTRLLAFGLALAFHLTNSYLFHIGVFPYLGIALCVLFFPGESLRRRFLPRKPPAPPPPLDAPAPLAPRERLVVAALAAYLALQLALPLRHHLYPGPVEWTEEGHRMSWRMMLRQKSGYALFHLHHPPSGERWTVRPAQFLTEKQAERVTTRPDLLWQFARFLARHYAAERGGPVEVRVRSRVSLNGRPPQTFVDPDVDLATTDWSFLGPNRWIVPFEEEERSAR
jgi:vitamin K-dependent gamma-carboxylase